MIGVDTNVLARLFVKDDPGQHDRAKRFFAGCSSSAPAFVSVVVVAEFVWLLTRTFDYAKRDVIEAIRRILSSPDFVVERRELVERAIEIASRSKAQVADVLIEGLAAAHGAAATKTFDIDAAKFVPGMELLK